MQPRAFPIEHVPHKSFQAAQTRPAKSIFLSIPRAEAPSVIRQHHTALEGARRDYTAIKLSFPLLPLTARRSMFWPLVPLVPFALPPDTIQIDRAQFADSCQVVEQRYAWHLPSTILPGQYARVCRTACAAAPEHNSEDDHQRGNYRSRQHQGTGPHEQRNRSATARDRNVVRRH